MKRLVSAVAALMFSAVTACAADVRYELRSIHPDGAANSRAVDIADDGTVLLGALFGTSYDWYLSRGSALTKLEMPRGVDWMQPKKFTSNGALFGMYGTRSSEGQMGSSSGFLYEAGRFTTIELPGQLGDNYAEFAGISPDGRFLVGWTYGDSYGNPDGSGRSVAFRLDRRTDDLVILDTPAFDGTEWSPPIPHAVSNEGVVMVELGGRVDASRDPAIERFSYLYDPAVGVVRTWGSSGSKGIELQDMNANGDYVGVTYELDDHGFIASAAIGKADSMTEFHGPYDWTVLNGINASGVGVGAVTKRGADFGYAVMAIPVPEAHTSAMMLFGFVVVATAASRSTGRRRTAVAER